MKKLSKKLSPDFLQIPYKLVCDNKLSPMDKMVYGGVYFFSKMRGEACYASNQYLAELLKTTSNTVSRSLKKLEERRYIYRTYEDPENMKKRIEIMPLITMGKTSYKKASRVIPNGITSQQKSDTRNGIQVIPNGIQGYSKWNTDKMPYLKQAKSAKTAKLSQKKRVKDQKKVIPFGIYIENIEEENKNIYKEFDFSNEKSGKKNFKFQKDQDQSKMVKNKTRPRPPTKSKKIDGAKVNEAIALFLEIVPGDFIGSKTAFSKLPTREAVEALLARHSIDKIKTLINKYKAGETDQYRPQVGTVYEFCTTKLAKIEAYVKKTGGLWAQRSISSEKHGKLFDSRVDEIMEKNREEARRAKKEWEDDMKKLNKKSNGK